MYGFDNAFHKEVLTPKYYFDGSLMEAVSLVF